MSPWRDVRGERRITARFVDGPNAGSDRVIPSAPDGTPPAVVRLADALQPHQRGQVVYELVGWGSLNVARYRVADPPAS